MIMREELPKNYWYAVLLNAEDDWYYGNEDLMEAMQMAVEAGPEAFVAVIDDSDKLNPKCIRYITQAEFSEVDIAADFDEGNGYTS
ncbi:MAG: hypothetical protein IJX90_12050 [Blautia sp.]|nr:hypothetical protein [Blautia sp.]